MRKLLQLNSDNLRQKGKLSDATVRSLPVKGILAIGLLAISLLLVTMIAAIPASAVTATATATVSGTVCDELDQPMYHATVYLSYEGNENVEARTDESGAFKYTDVPMGVNFGLKAKGGDPVCWTEGTYWDSTNGDRTGIELVINTGEGSTVSIHGYVMDMYEHTLSGATVFLRYSSSSSGSEPVSIQTTSGSSGEYSFVGLPGGSFYSLSATWGDYATDEDEHGIIPEEYEILLWIDTSGTPVPTDQTPTDPTPTPEWTPFTYQYIPHYENAIAYCNDSVLMMVWDARNQTITYAAPGVSTPVPESAQTSVTPTPTPTPTPAPTVTPAPTATSESTPTPVPTASESTNLSIWILGLIVVGVVAVGGYWVFFRQK